MIPRYTLPPMADLWTDGSKFSYWLKVELAILQARRNLGRIPPECFEEISKHASFDIERIAALEATYGHDLIAFVECVRERLIAAGVPQPYADEFHKRQTSYDIEDPATMLMLLRAGELILEELTALRAALLEKAREHRSTLMIFRTHGQFAEPSSFGHLLLVYANSVGRSIIDIRRAMERHLCNAKMSGAVGNYAGLDPEVERKACTILGLNRATVATQILQRDHHAHFLAAIAIAGATIEQIMKTFWLMMHSCVGELEEPRSKTQRGSSAMPWKKNPHRTEQLWGLPRLLRAYLQAAMEDVAVLEARDISQSSVERIIFPDSTTLLHYMAHRAAAIVRGLVVKPERMMENLRRSNNTWAGQRLRYALVDSGVPDSVAYAYVQQVAFEAITSNMSMADVLSTRPLSDSDTRTASEVLSLHNLGLFDPESYVRDGINEIFSRFEFS